LILSALALVLTLTLAALVPGHVGADSGAGNSAAAHACQQSGYLTLVRADGSNFTSVADCVGYAANGGTLTGRSANDFLLSLNPASANVPQGASTNATVSTAVTAGTAGTVSLAITGNDNPGLVATSSISPQGVTAGGSAVLRIAATSGQTGIAHLTITGTEGTVSHSVTFTLTVI
jgi:hypothetical protein